MGILEGIIPATVTPFDDKEQFVPAAYEKLIERLFSAGVHGLYVCGGTGEGLLQTVEQRRQVAEVALRNASGKPVIVHVGSFRTADAVDLAKHASRAGAAAISALPPLGGYSFPEVKAYYEAIAAVSDVPLLVYFFPESYPGVSNVSQVLELCSIPNVVGLKYTDFDLYRLRNIKQTGAVIFNGRDEVLVAGLLMGADGGIGTFYNVLPELFVEIYRHARNGDWEAARRAQDVINQVIRITLEFPCFPAVKEILRWRGVDCGPCIRPRGGLSPEQARDLRRKLDSCGIA